MPGERKGGKASIAGERMCGGPGQDLRRCGFACSGELVRVEMGLSESHCVRSRSSNVPGTGNHGALRRGICGSEPGSVRCGATHQHAKAWRSADLDRQLAAPRG